MNELQFMYFLCTVIFFFLYNYNNSYYISYD